MNTDDFRKAYIRHASALLRQPNLIDDARQSGHDVGELAEDVLTALDRINRRAEDMADLLQRALVVLDDGLHDNAEWKGAAQQLLTDIAQLGGGHASK
jgi:hypothetical protein